jgi:hypothetical protein
VDSPGEGARADVVVAKRRMPLGIGGHCPLCSEAITTSRRTGVSLRFRHACLVARCTTQSPGWSKTYPQEFCLHYPWIGHLPRERGDDRRDRAEQDDVPGQVRPDAGEGAADAVQVAASTPSLGLIGSLHVRSRIHVFYQIY